MKFTNSAKSILSSGGDITANDVTITGDLVAAGVTATGLTIGSAVITEAELEIIDGATLSTTELNYVDGVTSAIQTQLDAKQPVDADLTALSSCQSGSAAALALLTSTEVAILDGATLSTTELNYVDGVTSAIQTQIDGKQPVDADLTALSSCQSGSAAAIALLTSTECAILDGATLSTTELNYVDGVTSAIQTQLDGKSPVAGHASIVTVGTIGTGTWQGGVIASAYLDADTAHLSGTQTFSGAKTFSDDVVISGTTPQLTIGDAGAEDSMLIFDGNAVDFRIGLDDGTDTLEIGKGSAHGTTPAIKIDSSVNVQIMHNSAVADGEFSGDVAVFQAGEDLTAGECVYFKSDGKCWKAVATTAATSRCVAMATATISANAFGVFLLKGFARFDSEFPTWTIGGTLFTPEAETSSKNVPEQAAPDTDGDFVQVIGFAISGDAVYFSPDSTVIEVA